MKNKQPEKKREIEECKLCGEASELQNSHIIPEFLYTKIYTKKHNFLPINSSTNNKLKFEQKGYREYMLCKLCETKISRWESYLKKTLEEFVEPTNSNINIIRIEGFQLVSGLNYLFLKLAIVSISWRLSIACAAQFSEYKLGLYQYKLREVLQNPSNLALSSYPTSISKALFNGVFYSEVLSLIGRGRFGNNYIMQSIVLNGFMVDIKLMEGKPISEGIKLLSLNEKGTLIIANESYDKLISNFDSFKKKTNDIDVIEFFAKYND